MPKKGTLLAKGDVKWDLELTDPLEAQKAEIHAIYKTKYEKPVKPSVGPAHSMREHILAMSLFPNVFNRKMVMTESGPE